MDASKMTKGEQAGSMVKRYGWRMHMHEPTPEYEKEFQSWIETLSDRKVEKMWQANEIRWDHRKQMFILCRPGEAHVSYIDQMCGPAPDKKE